MLDKLDNIEKKYRELELMIADPEVIADNRQWQKYVIEHSELTPLVKKIVEYRRTLEEMEGAQELIDSSDPEMRELAEMEYEALKEKKKNSKRRSRFFFCPKIQAMRKMSSWKFAPEPEGMKRGCLPPSCFACICAMRRISAGRRR